MMDEPILAIRNLKKYFVVDSYGDYQPESGDGESS